MPTYNVYTIPTTGPDQHNFCRQQVLVVKQASKSRTSKGEKSVRTQWETNVKNPRRMRPPRVGFSRNQPAQQHLVKPSRNTCGSARTKEAEFPADSARAQARALGSRGPADISPGASPGTCSPRPLLPALSTQPGGVTRGSPLVRARTRVFRSGFSELPGFQQNYP